jgi:hypothetical protein
VHGACKHTGVCAACGKGSPGKSGEACAGYRAAGACSRVGQQARCRRALCRGQQGERARCAGAQGHLAILRGLRTLEFERDDSKRPLSSQTGQVPRSARSGMLPVLPTTQRAPAARLLPNPAACTCCPMPGARLARFPWAPFATRRMHTLVLAGMQAHALSRDAPTCASSASP